jgi:hypothetical protein
MTDDVHALLYTALGGYSDYLGGKGCNDLYIPDTPEMRALWVEYNVWNSGATGPEHPQWIALVEDNIPEAFDAQLLVHDTFLLFLLKRQLGML